MKTYKTYRLSKQDIERKELNECKYGCSDVCAICGKPIKKNGYMLHMMPDGMLVDDPHEEIKFDICTEMGYFEVGSTCYKNFQKKAVEMTKEQIISIQ